MSEIFCPQCGLKCPATNRFCAACGAQLPTVEPQSPSSMGNISPMIQSDSSTTFPQNPPPNTQYAPNSAYSQPGAYPSTSAPAQNYSAPTQGQSYGTPSQYGSPQPYGTQPPNFVPSSKDKVVAGILAIVLGGIGVHKFYLGKIGQGFLYLIFCWTGIPAILGLIEGILYLLASDEEFHRRYVYS